MSKALDTKNQNQSSLRKSAEITKNSKNMFEHFDMVPPGRHFFYFVKGSSTYCLSSAYPVDFYPGTNLKMNYLHVPRRDWGIHHFYPLTSIDYRVVEDLAQY